MSKDKKKRNIIAGLASAKKEETPVETPEVKEEQITIMPTMMDASDTGIKENKVDLSAIIPTDETPTTIDTGEENTEAAMFLQSKDKVLKTDGVVVVGKLTEESATVNPGAKFPEQIDVELRRRKYEESLKSKKKTKKVRTISEEQKRSQTITSLIVLALIGVIIGAVYYILNRKTALDFQPLTVTVELGDSLPIRTAKYVKPGIGTNVNEMAYVLDKNQVKESQVGEYPFTVTFRGTTKTGKVIIQDTTPPELIVSDKIITEGTTYNAELFVDDCHDWSGCSYSFQDAQTTEKYREAGEYDIYVVASDPYGNKTTKKVKLTIEEQGMVKKYVKYEEYNPEKGYSLKTTYDLHFTGFMDEPILLRGYEIREYTYQDEAKYNADYEAQKGNKGWEFNPETKVITYKSEAVNTIDRYSRMTQLCEYLESIGYTIV